MSPAPIPDNEQDDPGKNQDDHLDVNSMETPQFNIAAGSSSDSDLEDDDPSNHGYQLLPQDIEMGAGDEGAGVVSQGTASDSRVAEQAIAGSMEVEYTAAGIGSSYQVPPLPHTEDDERRDLWAEPRPSGEKQPMDQDHADKIKAVMAGISLPTCQQPSWAKMIPEDQWKRQLLGKIKPDSKVTTVPKDTESKSKVQTTDKDSDTSESGTDGATSKNTS